MTHWIDGKVLYDFYPICTDPRRVIGESTPRVHWRHYTDNEINFPQSVYMAGLAVQTEPFVPPAPPIPPIDLPLIGGIALVVVDTALIVIYLATVFGLI